MKKSRGLFLFMKNRAVAMTIIRTTAVTVYIVY